MSEKKFYIKFYIFGDNIRGNFGEVDKPLNNTEIVDLLNEQQATIKHLTIEKHQADKRFQTILAELKKENEQLKIANARWVDKSLQDRQIRYSNANHKELTKKYLQLKEENEQLRKRLEHYKEVETMDGDGENVP